MEEWEQRKRYQNMINTKGNKTAKMLRSDNCMKFLHKIQVKSVQERSSRDWLQNKNESNLNDTLD